MPGLAELLDELDQLVADVGGRVYLAKDSRLRPELVPVMYPDLDRFAELRDRVDPAGVLQSDLHAASASPDPSPRPVLASSVRAIRVPTTPERGETEERRS